MIIFSLSLQMQDPSYHRPVDAKDVITEAIISFHEGHLPSASTFPHL